MVGGISISDRNRNYRCRIDMGDGTVLEECNPSSYRYARPGIYDIVVDVYDVRHEQSLCRTRSFVNVPPKPTTLAPWYDQWQMLHDSVAQYCSLS